MSNGWEVCMGYPQASTQQLHTGVPRPPLNSYTWVSPGPHSTVTHECPQAPTQQLDMSVPQASTQQLDMSVPRPPLNSYTWVSPRPPLNS